MINAHSFDKISLLRLAFNGLADDELQEMAALTEICTYPPEHILCHEGAYEDIFYIIADGSAVISKKISEQEGERILRTERYFGKVSRSFQLAQEIDEAQVQAKYTDGVLELSLPKKTAAQARRITIQ